MSGMRKRRQAAQKHLAELMQRPGLPADTEYDFEYPFGLYVVCKRCGAQVQKRDVHDEWHASVVTRDLLIEVLNAATERKSYDG